MHPENAFGGSPDSLGGGGGERGEGRER